MKSHIKNAHIMKLGMAKTLSVLAVATLTVLATFLVSFPVPAASQTVATLQCQVSANGISIACSASVPPDVTAIVNCQSSSPISNNNGVFTIAPANCSGSTSLPTTGDLNADVLTIDTNNGQITAVNGTGTLSYNQGIASETLSCTGALFSQTLTPLELNIPSGTCNVNVGVLGIGIAQITTQSGSISATTSPHVVLSINSPTATVTTSVLGLVTNISCGTSITVNLSQLPPIIAPLAPCSGS